MDRLMTFTLVCLVLALPLLAGAQGLGSISGTVTDASGAVVVSAQVKVADPATGFSRTATTDSQGYYMISSLQPADYTVTVSAASFRTFSQANVTLLADQALTLSPRLTMGSTSEVVEVHAEALQVDTSTSTIKPR